MELWLVFQKDLRKQGMQMKGPGQHVEEHERHDFLFTGWVNFLYLHRTEIKELLTTIGCKT